jgi:hypothetical protein
MASDTLRWLLPCEPGGPRNIRRIEQAVAQFLRDYPAGRIIKASAAWDLPGVDSMQDVLSTEAYWRYWHDGYREADALLARADASLRPVLQPFYHAIAEFALQLTLIRAAAALSGPLLVIAPPLAAKLYRELGFQVLKASSRGSIAGINFARVARAIAAMMRRGTRRDVAVSGAAAARPSATGPIVLIVIDEGISGVNLPSALSVAKTLQDDGRRVMALVSVPHALEALSASGIEVLFAGAPKLSSLGLEKALCWRRYLRLMRRNASGDWNDRALLALIEPRLLAYSVFRWTVDGLLDELDSTSRLAAGLIVNEGTPIGIAALSWLQAHDIPDVGYWPALLGDRPDCDYFPARLHLVYGDQLRDRMLKLGYPPKSVESVGSVNFDRALGRDRTRDEEYVRTQILRGRTKRGKLVVVATECLPRPLDEIGPILEALAAMVDVEIVLKLHPADSVAYYREALAARGMSERVLLVESCALDALLHTADLLICVLSNIIVNAAELGTPTLVVDFGHKRQPLDFVTEGLAKGCFEPSRISESILDILNGPPRDEVIRRLKPVVQRFNQGADGRSALRVAQRVSSLIRN